LRPGRPSLASQSTRTKPFKPEPNERTSLYSFLRRAEKPAFTQVCPEALQSWKGWGLTALQRAASGLK
jgi:hypothetical protein